MTFAVFIIVIGLVLLTITFILGELEKTDDFVCPQCGSFMDEIEGNIECWRCNG